MKNAGERDENVCEKVSRIAKFSDHARSTAAMIIIAVARGAFDGGGWGEWGMRIGERAGREEAFNAPHM